MKGKSIVLHEPAPDSVRLQLSFPEIAVLYFQGRIIAQVIQQLFYGLWRFIQVFHGIANPAGTVTFRDRFPDSAEEFHVLLFGLPGPAGRTAEYTSGFNGSKEYTLKGGIFIDDGLVHDIY
jgi:hypothetical protein